MTFYDFAKHKKLLIKQRFGASKKSWTKYLIKPVVYWSFWGPFRKMTLKMIKKALGSSLKVDDVLRIGKTPKNLYWNNVLELAKKLFKIHYKTFRLLIHLGPFSEKGPQNYQKTITFSTKSWWRFTSLQNIKKPLVKQHFGACKKVVQNTL